MEENNMNVLLIEKLIKLNELEINKSKVLYSFFKKTTQEIMDKKISFLETSFKEQAKYYNQKTENYQEKFDLILSKYKKQLSQIIEKYDEFFVNIQLELQEAECNQKIAITNLKKSCDIKKAIQDRAQIDRIEEYNKKIEACMQKKDNYDIIIEECEKKLNDCTEKVQDTINILFSDNSGQLALREESGFKKIINKIKNLFTGKTNFNAYFIEPTNIEVEMIENKLPDTLYNLKNDTINFVAKIKQAKDETNKMFKNTING